MSEFSEASGGLFFDANTLTIEGAYKKANIYMGRPLFYFFS